ncbi:MAG: hypothetical protein J1F07_05980 [Muribaculaceae bacterium]|nr:hypothetical protein [Muribaculaceae bacterium]
METVNKGPEPTAWENFRNTPGADFSATPELKFALLREGGFVCAYCGRRIPCSDPLSDNKENVENDIDEHTINHRTDTMHVEHFWPRKFLKTPEERMVYANLIACCPGFISRIGNNKKANLYSSHCDHRKGSRVLHLNIFQRNLGDKFRYITNMKSPLAGAIMIEDNFVHTPESDEKDWLDINRRGWDAGHSGQLLVNLQNEIAPMNIEHDDNVLNLNHRILRINRASVIKAIQTQAKKYGSHRAWWERLLIKFSTMSEFVDYLNPITNNEERFMAYPPYRSIAIFYIKKKLRQC